jgi:PAS domain S-box-containing protein
MAALHRGGNLPNSVQERAHDDVSGCQQHFREAFDNAVIGMALLGTDGRCLHVNSSFCEITGHSADALLNKRLQDMVVPVDRVKAVERVDELLRGEIGSYQQEVRFLHGAGQGVPVLLSMSLVAGGAGDPRYLLAQIQDTTERKRAEEYHERLYQGQTALVKELAEAHLLKSELFSIVSHEFKTPLAGIIGFTGLLSRRGERLSEEERVRYLQTIARQAERLNRLIENLFFSARSIEPDPGAAASIEEAVQVVRSQLADTYDDVAFEVAVPEGLRPGITQDALWLVLANLASNAVKHARPDTNVRVAAWKESADVVIAVTNRGDPIPPEAQARIFDPFVRSGVPGRTAEGVGLGLHIVAKLVTAYRGSVRVASANGEVTFTVRLPEAPQRPGRLDLAGAGRVA